MKISKIFALLFFVQYSYGATMTLYEAEKLVKQGKAYFVSKDDVKLNSGTKLTPKEASGGNLTTSQNIELKEVFKQYKEGLLMPAEKFASIKTKLDKEILSIVEKNGAIDKDAVKKMLIKPTIQELTQLEMEIAD